MNIWEFMDANPGLTVVVLLIVSLTLGGIFA